MSKKLKYAAIIPARYQSERLPGKLLKLIGSKPVLQHVYDNASALGIFDEVLIACDADIYDKIKFDCSKVKTGLHHNGTARLIEAVHQVEADVIINIQGDEPFLPGDTIKALTEEFQNEMVEIATLISKLKNPDQLFDYNKVKVVTDAKGYAMYFSRQAIPGMRDKAYRQWFDNTDYYLHHGVYAFRKDVLRNIGKMGPSPLGNAEKLEQLDWMYHGFKIKCVTVEDIAQGIDTQDDLDRARAQYRTQ